MAYRVLLTRPSAQNKELSEQIKNSNIKTESVPLEKIIQIDNISFIINDILQNIKFDILIFTSQNAIRLFAQYSDIRELPIFVAGNASYELALSLGYKIIYKCDKIGAQPILENIIANFRNKKFLYITGSPHYLDFEIELNNNNIYCKKIVIYKGIMDNNAAENISLLLKYKPFDATLLFSSHAARIFNNYILPSNNIDRFGKILVLSKKIADNLTVESVNQIVILDDRAKIINFLMEQSNYDAE